LYKKGVVKMMDFGLPKAWACDECPIVCEFEGRLRIAQEDGHFEYFGLFDHCGCEKIDGKLWMWHGCEDAWADEPAHQAKGKRKTGRAYRRAMRVKKFERQKDIALNQNGAIWLGMDKTNMPAARPYHLWKFDIDDSDVKYTYIRRLNRPDSKKFLKRYANKLFRRADFIGKSRSYNKKLFNVMWELW